ncbi:unnamed protein product [Urochloa humidicola]
MVGALCTGRVRAYFPEGPGPLPGQPLQTQLPSDILGLHYSGSRDIGDGIGVSCCLVLPPNFSIYEQLPSRRRHLRRPSKSTWSAAGVVIVVGHPLASTEVPFTGTTPTEAPAPILQGQLAAGAVHGWRGAKHIVHQIW